MRILDKVNHKLESFIEECSPLVDCISPEDAKVLYNSFRFSLRGNKDERIIKVHILNARYTFAKRGEIPQSIAALINHLALCPLLVWEKGREDPKTIAEVVAATGYQGDSPKIFWNALLQLLDVRFNS